MDEGDRRATVSVTGTGRVERAADLALATFVVEAPRPTAAEARGAAAETACGRARALAAAGVADADVRTAGLDVSPTLGARRHPAGPRAGSPSPTGSAATVRDLELSAGSLDAGSRRARPGSTACSSPLADRPRRPTRRGGSPSLDAGARAATIAEAAGVARAPGRDRGSRRADPAAAARGPDAAMAADWRPCRWSGLSRVTAPTAWLPGRDRAHGGAVSRPREWELAARGRSAAPALASSPPARSAAGDQPQHAPRRGP